MPPPKTTPKKNLDRCFVGQDCCTTTKRGPTECWSVLGVRYPKRGELGVGWLVATVIIGGCTCASLVVALVVALAVALVVALVVRLTQT